MTPASITKLVTGALATATALAVLNRVLSRRARCQHPPTGEFMEVDGAVLHYRDHGEGPAVVLIHGTLVTGDDWNTSGVAPLLPAHRVIIFDRPG